MNATPRIEPLEMEATTGRARELLDELAARGTQPGPMVRAMAHAPALLRGYVDLSRAMKRTHLDRRITERIALAVHEWIGCGYCLAAHRAAALELGLSETDIELARQGTASDARVAAILAFGQALIAAPAEIDDARIEELRAHGYSDEQLAEVVGLVALQQLTGSFNLLVGLEADAPVSGQRAA